MQLQRCPENPIVKPGEYEWRKSTVFNPAVIFDNGKFYMLERAGGSLSPHITYLGLLESEDGIHFTHVKDEPVLTPSMVGLPYGSVQDPRLVKIDSLFYLVIAVRKYCTFQRAPRGFQIVDYYCEWDGNPEDFAARSMILTSKDLIHWDYVGYTTPEGIDDRDNILFPEKINGKFALLRRPLLTGGSSGSEEDIKPGMWISYSDDLAEWSEPALIALPEEKWESQKIGGSTPPIKTEKGWLVIYHGVDDDVVYRVGALLLDLKNPEKILARTKFFIMEPHEEYEKVGLIIPNVIFPTANIVKDGKLYLYYGCCDTTIGLATVGMDELLAQLEFERIDEELLHRSV